MKNQTSIYIDDVQIYSHPEFHIHDGAVSITINDTFDREVHVGTCATQIRSAGWSTRYIQIPNHEFENHGG